jgi:dimeric dUTPase (all-alpha-NTP-PPase superfamily)
MDKLDSMFEIQNNLQDRLGTFDKIKNLSDQQEFINQMILAIHEEATEIIKKTPYKNPQYVKFGWKKTQKMDLAMYKMEIIDLWHFVMNLCLVVGMGPEEFYRVYCDKNKENHDRQDNSY